MTAVMKTASGALESMVHQMQSKTDYIDAFFQSLAGQFRFIPPHLQPQAMLKLQQCVTELLTPPVPPSAVESNNSSSFMLL